jgi:hypothetical protein
LTWQRCNYKKHLTPTGAPSIVEKKISILSLLVYSFLHLRVFLCKLKKKSLDKFVEIYKKEYGVELTEGEALSKATALINLYRAVLGNPFLGAK